MRQTNELTIHESTRILKFRKPKVKKSNLYTGGGDKGESSLYNGARVPKDNLIFEALGGTDELNAHLGVAREYCRLDNNGIDEYLTEVGSGFGCLVGLAAQLLLSSCDWLGLGFRFGFRV